jgi:hypothetical protein
MKRPNDAFVLVNANSPKKRRRKTSINYGELLSFGNIPSGSDSLKSSRTQDENQPHPMLGSPWVPTPRFKTWDPSKIPSNTGSGSELSSSPWNLNATVNKLTSCGTTLDDGRANETSCSPSESPPVVLELSNTLGDVLETSNLRVYESPDIIPPGTQNGWNDCKKEVLKLFSDAGRSPLDLIIDLLDLDQDEYEHYRTRWFSSNCNKISVLLDLIFAHPKGHDLILHWVRPHSLEAICTTVASEMDLVVKELSFPSVEDVSSEFISNWTLERVVEPATKLCPSLLHILEAAAQTQEAKRKNKIKFPKTVSRNIYCAYTSTQTD